ncbi:MAG: ATP-binding protein [bacterium]
MQIPLIAYQAINLFNALLSLSLGILVLLTNKRSKQIILFSAFAFSVFFWDIFYFFAFQTNSYELSSFLFRTCMIAGALILPIFTEFVFTLDKRKIPDFWRGLNFGLALIIIIFIYTDFYAYDGGPFLNFHYWPIIGFLSFVQILHYGANVLFSHKELIRIAKEEKPKLRQQAKIIVVGTSLGYLGAATNFLLWFRIPFPPILNILIPIYVASVAYAITKHELMDIRVAITRSAAYGIVAVMIVGSFIWLNLIHLPLIVTIFANAVLGLFWSWAAHRLREFIQTPLEEKWITGWYNSDTLINNIAQSLVPVSEKEEALRIISKQLKETIKIKEVHFILGKKDHQPKPIEYILLANEAKISLSADHPLIKTLAEQTQTVISYDNLATSVKEAIDGLEVLKAALFIPLSSSEGLEGIVILGEKVSEDPYSQRDITLFKTIMVQALAIFDRIRPYEKIKHDFEATQKKLYDTERILARSEKIAALATLIREYNHEIKTPLTIIRSELALWPEDPKLAESKKAMIEAIRRASDIVESTLRLSQPKEHHEVDVNINEVLEYALNLFPPSGVHLAKKLQKLPIIKGDKQDLRTVFINLIKNAVEAMPEGGELKIKTYTEKESDKELVCVEISDTGAGIPEENREKIFEPFFSTHVTKGRGLGLSIVFRIIREHSGSITFKSKVGKGTTFKISF